jgi:hypothetical protein
MKFIDFLQDNPLYLDKLRAKVGRWEAEDMEELQRKAARYAREHPLEGHTAKACGWISWGLGIVSMGLAPVSGGGSIVIGIGGAGIGLLDLTDQC